MTEAIATDWLVSITPTARGDFQTPGGIRYNVTYHNGASAAMLEALIAELDASADLLMPARPAKDMQPSVINSYTGESGNINDGTEGRDIYGVGFVPSGSEFVVDIERIAVTSNSNNNIQFELYRPGNEYAFVKVSTKNKSGFEALQAFFNGQIEIGKSFDLDPMVPMRFRISHNETSKGNKYIDFIGLASANQQDTAPASDNGGGNWAQDAESRDKFVSWAELHHGLSATLLKDCFSVKDLSAITCDKPEAMRKVAAYARQLAQQQDEESADIPF